MPAVELDRYGRLDVTETNGQLRLAGLLEKSSQLADGRQALVNISRYVFPASFLDVLGEIAEDAPSGSTA